MTEHIRKKSWRTTLVGAAQLFNGLYQAFQTAQAALVPHVSVELQQKILMHMAIFFGINAVLQQLKGLYAKDEGKGSDRPQEVVDRKLDNVAPRD